MKSWLQDNDIKTYSTHNQGKSVVAENTFINIGKEVNYKDPTFKIGDYLRISKSKRMFATVFTQYWS